MNRKDNVKFNFDLLSSNGEENKYKVHLEIPMNVGWIDYSVLVIDDKEMPLKFIDNKNGYAIFETNVVLPRRAVYSYYFKYMVNRNYFFINRRDTKQSIQYDEKNKISVLFDAPEWAKGAMMYHIFVDRYNHGGGDLEPNPRRQILSKDEDVVLGDNKTVFKHYEGEQVWNVDFYGGDLKGIEEKLDYIKSMGFSIIYLSPIVKSQSNHGYDAIDYEEIDPYKGTKEDLKRLCDAAHKRGMKVVLDAVFNHVGDESKYFDRYGEHRTDNEYENGAFNNPNSKYHDFFHYDENGDFCYWYNFKTLPKLNCEGKMWRDYICGEGGVIDQWFDCGIDGIRLDVADELTDSALEEIYKAVIRNKKDGFILGEVWENPMRVGRSYISSGKSMHSVMNYQLFEGLIKFFKYKEPHRLHYTLRDIQAEYPKPTIDTAMNFTSTHDFSRIMTLLGKKRFDPYHRFNNLDQFFKDKIIESLWEMGFSNNAIIELLNGKREIDYYQYRDLIEKLKWKGIYGDALEYIKSSIGFSPFDRGKKWSKDLPEDIEKDLEFTRNYRLTEEEYLEARDVYEAYLLFLISYPGIFTCFYGDEIGMEGLNNLANRGAFPWGYGDKKIFKYFLSLGQFRNKYPFLKEAEFYLLDLIPEFVSFERIGDNDKMFVAINNSDQERRIILPNEYKDGDIAFTLKKSKKDFLSPYGGVIIKK